MSEEQDMNYNQTRRDSPGASSYFNSEARAEFGKWQLDPEEILIELEHDLKGEVWIEGTEEKSGRWERLNNPVMTDDQINLLIGISKPMFKKDIALSNLEVVEINDIAEEFEITFLDSIVKNYKAFNSDTITMGNVQTLFGNKIKIALKRALDGITAEQFSGSHKSIETYMQKPEGGQPNGNFFTKMFKL